MDAPAPAILVTGLLREALTSLGMTVVAIEEAAGGAAFGIPASAVPVAA